MVRLKLVNFTLLNVFGLASCAATVTDREAASVAADYMQSHKTDFGCTSSLVRNETLERSNRSFVWECVDNENKETLRIWIQVDDHGKIHVEKEGSRSDEDTFELKLRE